MEGNYPVLFGSKTVGKVQVRRQGLYYLIDCRCRLESDVICRLQIQWSDKKESLGIVVPEGDGFGLKTRFPVKKAGVGEQKFSLVPKYDKADAAFAPIYPDEPFAYISRLKDAYLVRKNGEMGIYI